MVFRGGERGGNRQNRKMRAKFGVSSRFACFVLFKTHRGKEEGKRPAWRLRTSNGVFFFFFWFKDRKTRGGVALNYTSCPRAALGRH